MKLTTKGRYAVTAMLDLAIHAQDTPVTLQEISGRQGISLSYLEQLFAKLRRNELVKSIRGPGGGYQLQDTADSIVISRVIDAVNESTDVTACGGKGNCHDGKQCITHDLWCELSEQIHQFLSNITLQTVIDKQQAKQQREKAGESITIQHKEDTFILSEVS
ncbi:Fe-S cluster assembly transcriptional regulator IscR [Pleionea litopenaei]|uniref:Fe-S cluster assembly transcriptional regulator IscR n=1 Tax=Pleionea litopenaei TaxID=3070815 RepID=A0AA51RU79_9GAMM|nr:Fe-S cluster assembly transcriptional regulator IscR [Pleionea sp. HL-JVS1]WMS87605.1 Fe-S cluster assembly transcriptional regulator IscR [Pleionea sp. HL-JVS1]